MDIVYRTWCAAGRLDQCARVDAGFDVAARHIRKAKSVFLHALALSNLRSYLSLLCADRLGFGRTTIGIQPQSAGVALVTDLGISVPEVLGRLFILDEPSSLRLRLDPCRGGRPRPGAIP
jgi:hypothetical protein